MLRLKVGDLELDLLTRKVARAGRGLELSGREFELLEYLLRHVDRMVSREMLAQDVWKETARTSSMDNLIDVYMTRLRKKVDHGFSEPLLHTVRGVGFVLSETAP